MLGQYLLANNINKLKYKYEVTTTIISEQYIDNQWNSILEIRLIFAQVLGSLFKVKRWTIMGLVFSILSPDFLAAGFVQQFLLFGSGSCLKSWVSSSTVRLS